MSDIRELSFNELTLVSGGEGHGTQINRERQDPDFNSNNRYNDPNVANCNNGIIGGAIAGLSGGAVGMALGVVGGAIAGGCFNGSGNKNNNGCNAGSNNCNNGNAASKCNW